jgi:hypothetical protein
LSLVEGRNLEKKAFYFNGIDDRIVVFPSETLTNLRAIRITAWIWIEELGQRRNIVEGYLSFALSIEDTEKLRCGIYDGAKWNTISTHPNAIPIQEWVLLKFIYDGINTAALYVNGNLVASENRHLGQVRTIQWPFELNIGAWPDANKFVFKGKISEIKIWAYG